MPAHPMRMACVRLTPVGAAGTKVGVVGHVEWVQFARVEHVPRAGEVVHASEPFDEPAGGGAVAAVQLARLAGAAAFVTAVGDDGLGQRSIARLRELGVDVYASILDAATRRAVTLVDDEGERTITTFGPRLRPDGYEGHAELAALAGSEAVYFTAGDVAALRAARNAARILVASPRAGDALGHGVALDALVLSKDDEIELSELDGHQHEAEVLVFTEGDRGGRYRRRDGTEGRWSPAAPPGELVDFYGCGDSFAAGLTYGLGAGLSLPDSLALAARCGAVCMTGRGPYGRQLRGAEL